MAPVALPSHLESVEALDELLSRPTLEVVEALRGVPGDIMILGVGGKMGPTLAMLTKRSIDEAGLEKRVIGVSRFSSPGLAQQLNGAGVETIACDLLDGQALRGLPDVPNIVYMVGMKFGATGREAETWAMNAFLPGTVVQRFRHSRIVLFSSGNVYPFAPAGSGGCGEATPPAPIGEYAQSVLGRERVFAHFAQRLGVPGVVLRLNYAVELRYGVLLDIAQHVWRGEPVSLSMGHLNAIWQGDANAVALRALALAEIPSRVINITGPETISVRSLALQFGALLGKEPVLAGSEESTALLNNAGLAFKLFGYPRVTLAQMVEWVAAWVPAGGLPDGPPRVYRAGCPADHRRPGDRLQRGLFRCGPQLCRLYCRHP